jgi:ATPase subunit of ABC transporter with duplicated ATPase domains
MQKDNTGPHDYGTNCLDCERYKRLGDVCVIEHEKKFLWDYCRDFVPQVVLPDYKELMQTVKNDQALAKQKAKEKKEREKRRRLKERLARKEEQRKKRRARLRKMRERKKQREAKHQEKKAKKKSESSKQPSLADKGQTPKGSRTPKTVSEAPAEVNSETS